MIALFTQCAHIIVFFEIGMPLNPYVRCYSFMFDVFILPAHSNVYINVHWILYTSPDPSEQWHEHAPPFSSTSIVGVLSKSCCV